MDGNYTNPFSSGQKLNRPLHEEICQEIHYTALKVAVGKGEELEIPDYIPVDRLRVQAARCGDEIFLAHPAQIAATYQEITLPVYQMIEQLYISRLGRSVETVFKILTKMAEAANVATPHHRAVWSICMFLHQRRLSNAKTEFERLETEWEIFTFTPGVFLLQGEEVTNPRVTCVLDLNHLNVLAFRVGENGRDEDEMASLAIYDAISAGRYPSNNSTDGVRWKMPAVIHFPRDLPARCRQAIEQLGIRFEPTENAEIALITDLRRNWDRDIKGQIFTRSEFNGIFDYYLHKAHGYGPLRTQIANEKEFYHLIGFNRDSAGQLPALRQLLPERSGVVTANGEVYYDGLHYWNTLLEYWPDQPITLQRSEYAESTAWINLDGGGILAEAKARELRRKDGSYRRHRIRRS